MSLIIDEHRQFLQDERRLHAFERAIADVVRPGDVVADLGSGTGILGLMAARAGARRVYAVDDTGMIGFVRRIARENHLADRIVAVRGHSSRVDLPERVDVIVSDMIGRIGFLDGGAESLVDVRRRWLKPGGAIMPASVATWIAPVEHADLFAQVDFWATPVEGFDMSSVRDAAANTGYPHAFEPSDLLAAGQPGAACDYRHGDADMIRGDRRFTVERDGRMHGLAAWFVAQLSPRVVLTNAPGAPDRINRRGAFLPLTAPVDLRAGDQVHVTLVIRPADFVVSWHVVCRRADQVLADGQQSTLRGMLLGHEDFRSSAADATPRLNKWARARATILELCDGTRALKDIEREVFDRHRDLFANLGHAQVFVAEVVSRYADVAPLT